MYHNGSADSSLEESIPDEVKWLYELLEVLAPDGMSPAEPAPLFHLNSKVTEKTLLHLIKQVLPLISAESMCLEVPAPTTVVGDIHGQYSGPAEDLWGHRGSTQAKEITRHQRSTGSTDFMMSAKYSIKLWRAFVDCFRFLPISAILGHRIFCAHGGLSPQLDQIEDIKYLHRPLSITHHGLATDLLWSDPDASITGWAMNQRGVSYTFGPDIIEEFLKTNGLDLVCRAHQLVEDGYEFTAGRKLVTIFSAPNYCGEFDNCGAVLRVSADLKCSFFILRPV